MEVADEAEAVEAAAEAAEEAAKTPTKAGTCRSSIHRLHLLPKKARSSKRKYQASQSPSDHYAIQQERPRV